MLYKAVVFSNIVQSMLAILRAMKDFDLDFDDDDLEHTANRFFEEAECKSGHLCFLFETLLLVRWRCD
jgi:hypothetical protein